MADHQFLDMVPLAVLRLEPRPLALRRAKITAVVVVVPSLRPPILAAEVTALKGLLLLRSSTDESTCITK
jgi:hypothetical protein